MPDNKRITQEELYRYVDSQLHAKGWNREMRDSVKAVFDPDAKDLEEGERSTLFHSANPGVSEGELKKIMEKLRDPNSLVNKTLRYPLHGDPKRLDELEGVMKEALEKNKEGWF